MAEPILQRVTIETEIVVLCRPIEVNTVVSNVLDNLDITDFDVFPTSIDNMIEIPCGWIDECPDGGPGDKTCKELVQDILDKKEQEQIKREQDKKQLKLEL